MAAKAPLRINVHHNFLSASQAFIFAWPILQVTCTTSRCKERDLHGEEGSLSCSFSIEICSIMQVVLRMLDPKHNPEPHTEMGDKVMLARAVCYVND